MYHVSKIDSVSYVLWDGSKMGSEEDSIIEVFTSEEQLKSYLEQNGHTDLIKELKL